MPDAPSLLEGDCSALTAVWLQLFPSLFISPLPPISSVVGLEAALQQEGVRVDFWGLL